MDEHQLANLVSGLDIQKDEQTLNEVKKEFGWFFVGYELYSA